jgi:hypothetical protein
VSRITSPFSDRRYHGVQTAVSEGIIVRILNTVVLFLGLVASAAVAATPEKPPATAAAEKPAAAAPEGAAAAYYRIELAPSGSYVAMGAPVTRGNTVLFHAYPDGRLMSLRRTDVRKVSPITAQEAAGPAKKDLVSIGNLAMQGGNGAPPSAAGAGANNAAHPAPAAGSPAFRPSGPAVIPVHDGVAVTTAPPPPD